MPAPRVNVPKHPHEYDHRGLKSDGCQSDAELDYRHHHAQPPDNDQRFMDAHLEALHALDKRLLDLLGLATSLADRLVGSQPQQASQDIEKCVPHGLAGELSQRVSHLELLTSSLAEELSRISRF